jgi:hypothetical protein
MYMVEGRIRTIVLLRKGLQCLESCSITLIRDLSIL